MKLELGENLSILLIVITAAATIIYMVDGVPW